MCIRDRSQPVPETEYRAYRKKFGEDYIFRIFDEHGLPTYETYKEGALLPKGYSILPFFPGYKYENGKSTFMGDEIGEGGRVFSRPGMYGNAWDGAVSYTHLTPALSNFRSAFTITDLVIPTLSAILLATRIPSVPSNSSKI